jgi:hypothetical protein
LKLGKTQQVELRKAIQPAEKILLKERERNVY